MQATLKNAAATAALALLIPLGILVLLIMPRRKEFLDFMWGEEE
jgi:hypothetical protein